MYLGRIFLTLMLMVIRSGYYLNNQMEKRALLAQPPEVTTSIQEIKLSARPLISEIQKLSGRVKQVVRTVPHQEVRNDCVIGLLHDSVQNCPHLPFGTRLNFQVLQLLYTFYFSVVV